jgi:DNA-binding CsgD family transcriptional regulator
MKPLVDILEAAYRFDDDETVWLRGVAEASRPLLDNGLGTLFYSYRAEAAFVHLESMGALGCSEGLLGALFAPVIAARDELQALAQAHRTLPMQTLRAILRPLPEIEQTYAQRLQQLGFADLVVANATDPSGRGCVILAPLAAKTRMSQRKVHAWNRVAAHVAAGRRVRQALAALRGPGTGELAAEAVLRPDGRLEEAGPEVDASARKALRQAALSIDRARGRLRKTNPDEALSTWHALTAGRWTLLDRFDQDGRRYLVAHRNDPHAPDARALTLRERQVLEYAALGHSNKLISYEMGLHQSSVSRHLRDAGIKLRAATRVELVRRYFELVNDEPPSPGEIDEGSSGGGAS